MPYKKTKIKTKIASEKIKRRLLKMLLLDNEKRIAMSGCFRSGTNYTKTLLETNFDCTVKHDFFGWKHGFIPILTKSSPIHSTISFDSGVFVTKNPFSFLVSLFNYFDSFGLNIKGEKEFSKFISNRIVIHDSSQDDSPELRFANPVEYWNAMNWNYLSNKNFTHICYESLVESPELVVSELAKKLHLTRRKGKFKNPTKEVKRTNDQQNFTFLEQYESKKEFNKNRYQAHQYMNNYKKADIEFILAHLDVELIENLGYTNLMASLRNFNG